MRPREREYARMWPLAMPSCGYPPEFRGTSHKNNKAYGDGCEIINWKGLSPQRRSRSHPVRRGPRAVLGHVTKRKPWMDDGCRRWDRRPIVVI